MKFSTTYCELIFNLCELFCKDDSFFTTGVNFFLENLSPPLEDLNLARFAHIADIVAFVFDDDAL